MRKQIAVERWFTPNEREALSEIINRRKDNVRNMGVRTRIAEHRKGLPVGEPIYLVGALFAVLLAAVLGAVAIGMPAGSMPGVMKMVMVIRCAVTGA